MTYFPNTVKHGKLTKEQTRQSTGTKGFKPGFMAQECLQNNRIIKDTRRKRGVMTHVSVVECNNGLREFTWGENKSATRDRDNPQSPGMPRCKAGPGGKRIISHRGSHPVVTIRFSPPLSKSWRLKKLKTIVFNLYGFHDIEAISYLAKLCIFIPTQRWIAIAIHRGVGIKIE